MVLTPSAVMQMMAFIALVVVLVNLNQKERQGQVSDCIFIAPDQREYPDNIFFFSTLRMLDNFACFFVVCEFFLKKNYLFHKIFQKYYQSIKRCFVGPNLGPKCLQRLSADNKSHH